MTFSISRTFQVTGGTDTSDATAEQWDVKAGKTAYIASGKVTGTAYTPAMMQFNGTTGYYSDTYTSSGNQVCMVARFKVAAFSGTSQRLMSSVKATGRLYVTLRSSDFATASERNRAQFFVQNSSGTTICSIFSESDVVDNTVHTVFFSFNGDTGATVLYVDGVAEDDTGQANRVAPTTGTLSSGTTTSVGVGADGSGGTLINGSIGFFGYTDTYLANWSDFVQSDGAPKQLSEGTDSPAWTEWGSQPLYWNEHGEMTNNLGSAGAMTKNGTIIVGKGGN